MGLYNVVNRALMQSGQPEDISQIVANLDAIAAVLNGGIDNTNVNGAAAIDYAKINVPASAIIPGKITPGTNGQVLTTAAGVTAWGAGTSGKTLLKVTHLFTGTVSYTPTTGTTAMFVECQGAGAGGGGTPNAPANQACGGGGGGGAYAAKWCTTFTAGAITVAIGAGGTSAVNAGGTAGGDTSFDVASANVVARGGAGGLVGVNTTSVLGGAGGLASTSIGDAKIDGQRGQVGTGASPATYFFTGEGGASYYGVGGRRTGALTEVGAVGVGFGGGGAGGCTAATAAQQAGGSGAPGLIRVWEFA